MLIALLALGASALAPRTRAQERLPDIAVLQTVAGNPTDPSTLPLSVVISLRDQNGNQIPKSAAKLGSATIAVTTPDNRALPPVPATVSDPQTPIRIALVLDRSGSMNRKLGGTGDQRTLDAVVRDAAVKSVGSASDQAEFAVFSFAQQTELRSGGFLRKSDQSKLIEDSIRGYNTNPPNSGNTCITDAALQAINYLNSNSTGQALERKAVILFTDGLDKEANGSPNNGNDCSNLNFDAIIRSAQLSSGTVIPIYTIWPCDPCDDTQRANMENLARETRGSSAVGSLQEVESLFQRVMELLNSQWVIAANVGAVKGVNTATIKLQIGEGETFQTTAAPFTSPITTIAAPTVAVAQQRYDEAADTYRVTLTIENPQNVGKLSAGVYNLETGGTLIGQEQTFDNLKSQLDFDLPTAQLKGGESYFLRITGTGSDGKPLAAADGKPLLISYPFKYEPKLSYTIGAINPEWGTGPLVVDVNVRGAGQRELSFSGEITNRNGGAKEALELTTLRDGKLRFPMPKMLRDAKGPSEYELMLHLEEGENVLERRTDSPITLAPPPPPPVNYLPYILAAIGVVLIGGLGGLLLMRGRNKKRDIPLPYNSATMLGAPSGKAAPSVAVPAKKPSVAPERPSAPLAPPVQSAPPPVVPQRPAPAAPPAALTEVRSSAPAPMPTVVHTPSEATVLHVAEQKPRVRIRVVKTADPSQVREQTLELPCTIGREQVSFAITGDSKISRRHAELSLEGTQLQVADLKSTNGTFVRGTKVQPGGVVSIEGVAEIGIGPNTVLQVELQ